MFVLQYTLQRMSTPDFGLVEKVLLPWYNEFTRQYVNQAWGGWRGNASLFAQYQRIAWANGEDLFAGYPKTRKLDDVQPESIFALGKQQ